MPIPSPFHDRTEPLCTSYRWKEWAGYYAVSSYDICHEREYNAFRQGAGMLDVSPLYKYDFRGREAAACLSRIMARGLSSLKVGRVVYACWTDDRGKIIDDGTIARLDDTHYRVTSASPCMHWFLRHSHGFEVQVTDTSTQLAALAIQGPMARDALKQVTDIDLDTLRFFGVASGKIAGIDGCITRTGYTGDLGYEVWVDAGAALPVWDALIADGKPYGLMPAGLDALDVCRVEAGFVLQGVDYTSSFEAVIDSQRSTPFELGLGWTVKLKNREPFIGQQALEHEKRAGSKWAFVGLDIDWEALEAVYDEVGLPPALPGGAWRDAIPVYFNGRQVGRATSGAWSPILKKNLALATVVSGFAPVGTKLDIEVTVEWERKTVPATVVATPFFDPPRKRAHGDDVR